MLKVRLTISSFCVLTDTTSENSFWIGLEIPNADATCHGISQCESTGKLQWSNGQSFQGGPDLTYDIAVDEDGITKCTYANVILRIEFTESY